MEQLKAMEYGSQKASPDVLKPHIYIDMYEKLLSHLNFHLDMRVLTNTPHKEIGALVHTCSSETRRMLKPKWKLT
jgi:hypothetical protein